MGRLIWASGAAGRGDGEQRRQGVAPSTTHTALHGDDVRDEVFALRNRCLFIAESLARP